MRMYEVVSAPFRLRPGAGARLTGAQVNLRAHRIEVTRRGADGMCDVTALEALDFKAGEKIGLETVSKADREKLREIEEVKNEPADYKRAEAPLAAPPRPQGRRA